MHSTHKLAFPKLLSSKKIQADHAKLTSQLKRCHSIAFWVLNRLLWKEGFRTEALVCPCGRTFPWTCMASWHVSKVQARS